MDKEPSNIVEETPEEKFERLKSNIYPLLDQIQKCFVDGMMVTIVARHPTDHECYTVFTADNDIREVAAILVNDKSKQHITNGVIAQ